MNLTSRNKYILSLFCPKYVSEKEALEIIDKINKIGEQNGFIGLEGNDDRRKHKYDTWIAVQTLKWYKENNNFDILNFTTEFQLILDWFSSERIDCGKLTFFEAIKQQEEWHNKKFKEIDLNKIELDDVDNERVIMYSKDKKYFFYLLDYKELKTEGQLMGHCVGGQTYQQKVKNNNSFIISLRDKKNQPHVTIEISYFKKTSTGNVVQCYGKGNQEPVEEYLSYIHEFVKNISEEIPN